MGSRGAGTNNRFVEMGAAASPARAGFAPLGGNRSMSGFRPFHEAAAPSQDPLPEAGGLALDADLPSALEDSVDGLPGSLTEDGLADGGEFALSGDESALLGGGAGLAGDDGAGLLIGEGEGLLDGEDEGLLGDSESALMGGADLSLPGEGGSLAVDPAMFDGALDETSDRPEPSADDTIAALNEQHERELEAVRAEYGGAVAERIGAGLQALEQQLLDGIATEVAQILAPILSEQARASSVAAFAEALRGALAEPGTVSIRVEGPADLLAHVRKELEGNDARLEFAEAEQTDLRARLGDSVITTRLTEWAAELAGAVDEQ